MERNVLSFHIGQAGIQIGKEIWGHIGNQHSYKSQDFHELQKSASTSVEISKVWTKTADILFSFTNIQSNISKNNRSPLKQAFNTIGFPLNKPFNNHWIPSNRASKNNRIPLLWSWEKNAVLKLAQNCRLELIIFFGGAIYSQCMFKDI